MQGNAGVGGRGVSCLFSVTGTQLAWNKDIKYTALSSGVRPSPWSVALGHSSPPALALVPATQGMPITSSQSHLLGVSPLGASARANASRPAGDPGAERGKEAEKSGARPFPADPEGLSASGRGGEGRLQRRERSRRAERGMGRAGRRGVAARRSARRARGRGCGAERRRRWGLRQPRRFSSQPRRRRRPSPCRGAY